MLEIIRACGGQAGVANTPAHATATKFDGTWEWDALNGWRGLIHLVQDGNELHGTMENTAAPTGTRRLEIPPSPAPWTAAR
jgi:hypothetical protein